jgi:hypothetical protein
MREPFVPGQCYCPQPEVNNGKCVLCGGTNPKPVEEKKRKVRK